MEQSILSVSRFVLLILASILLYFGFGMLLLVPGNPGGPYWVKERVVYGVIPLTVGLVSLAFSSWIAIRCQPNIDPVASIKRNLLYVVIGIVLVFVLLILNDVYFHVPVHF